MRKAQKEKKRRRAGRRGLEREEEELDLHAPPVKPSRTAPVSSLTGADKRSERERRFIIIRGVFNDVHHLMVHHLMVRPYIKHPRLVRGVTPTRAGALQCGSACMASRMCASSMRDLSTQR